MALDLIRGGDHFTPLKNNIANFTLGLLQTTVAVLATAGHSVGKKKSLFFPQIGRDFPGIHNSYAFTRVGGNGKCLAERWPSPHEHGQSASRTLSPHMEKIKNNKRWNHIAMLSELLYLATGFVDVKVHQMLKHYVILK